MRITIRELKAGDVQALPAHRPRRSLTPAAVCALLGGGGHAAAAGATVEGTVEEAKPGHPGGRWRLPQGCGRSNA